LQNPHKDVSVHKDEYYVLLHFISYLEDIFSKNIVILPLSWVRDQILCEIRDQRPRKHI